MVNSDFVFNPTSHFNFADLLLLLVLFFEIVVDKGLFLDKNDLLGIYNDFESLLFVFVAVVDLSTVVDIIPANGAVF